MSKKLLNYTYSNMYGVSIIHKIGTLILIWALFQGFALNYWLLSIGVYFLTGCLGITVTYHRFLSHRSFEMPKWMEYLFSFFGAMGGTGSPLGWVAVHRDHHTHSDTDKDPHSPVNGMIDVITFKYRHSFNKWSVRDLLSQSFHKNLHAYYHLWIALWALFWLVLSPTLFVFVVAVPMAIQIWVSIISNVLNHKWGYRNFETAEGSTNNFLIALISWGEGWHNNHHRYPSRWAFRVKWWEFDFSELVIWCIRKLTHKPNKVSTRQGVPA